MAGDDTYARDEAHCLDLVRQSRRGQYAALLYLPEAVRGLLAALEALDVELSRIPDIVSEPMAGEIRLQWWRDAATGEGAYDGGGNPLARMLRQGMSAHARLRGHLGELIDAHRLLLDALPFATAADFATHADARFGGAFRIRFHVLAGHEPDTGLDHVFARAGQARAQCDLIGRFAARARSGQCVLPQDALAHHGTTAQDALAGANARAVGAALEDSRNDALERCGEAAAPVALASPDDRRALALALLPLAVTRVQLAQFASIARNPYDPLPPPPYLRQIWALWRAARRI